MHEAYQRPSGDPGPRHTLRLITAKAAKRLGIEACVTFGISRKILWEPLEVTIFSKIAVPSNNAPNDHRFPLAETTIPHDDRQDLTYLPTER